MLLEVPSTNQEGHIFNTIHHFNWTKERLEGIIKFKEKFFKDAKEDPRKCPYLSKEVALSWIRSRELGINPYGDITERHLCSERHKEILNDNRLLISITKPLMDTFKDMAILTSGYIVYLCNQDGAFLLQEGEMMRMPIEGLAWTESTIGTCAHSMCMNLRGPIHLMGPEHYSLALMNIMASAAPIMDESGKIIATLILGQPLIENPWGEHFQNLRSHTLGLITSVASAVEAQLKLYKSNKKLMQSYDNLRVVNNNLTTAHVTLETTLSLIDEGIITIDGTGKIINLNQEGSRILRMQMDEIGMRNIKEFLGSQSNVMSLVAKGENVDIEEIVIVGREEQTYVINIRPVVNKHSQQVDVAILRLNHVEKVNALVASRSGAVANYAFEDMIGEDKEFKKVLTLAKRFARSLENILIIGESGTGKELFAQAIHNAHRPQGPFMVVNCAAMPRELIESELFGYEGGSFTGAERSGRPGKIELAHGGTLFLDEVGDMPLELQAVLLRTLEDKNVMRLGGRRYKKVDFRLIAATNKNLYKMVKEKQFREDLYFRLSVLNLSIPPLRERKNDIKALCEFFMEYYCQKQGREIPEISEDTWKIINEYEWPGNVRQLQNAIIYAVNTAQSDLIKPENLPSYILLENSPIKIDPLNSRVQNIEKMLSLEELEKAAIETALLHTNNNVDTAAEILGISRSTLYRKLKEYGIDR
jgi:transcriptional regulator with PAS, ATPase and Fis domain